MAEPGRPDPSGTLASPAGQDQGGTIAVALAWVDAQTGAVRLETLRVAAGCDVAGVVAEADRAGLFRDGLPKDWSGAVFGRLVAPGERVRDADRVELLGPLRVDPKVARMRRVAHRRAAAPGGKWNRDG